MRARELIEAMRRAREPSTHRIFVKGSPLTHPKLARLRRVRAKFMLDHPARGWMRIPQVN